MAILRTLYRSASGPDVAEWQLIIGATPDGFFGDETVDLTKAFQRAHKISPDGIVGPATRAIYDAMQQRVPTLPGGAMPIPFIQARYFTRGRYGTDPSIVVIHTMESQEKPGTAMNVAKWFAGDQAPQASAHYCIDSTSTVQCVHETDAAWGAPGANRTGIHLEHAGRAAQSAADWSDEYSTLTLKRSAVLCADICRRRGIPIKRIRTADLLAGASGICGHNDVTEAFKKGDHTDPGPNFPWSLYIDMVMAADGSES